MLRIISLVIMFIFYFGLASAATTDYDIESVDSTNQNVLKMFVNNDITSSDTSLNGEVKILKDIKVSSIEKIKSNKKAIKINLTSDLEKNSSYSILSINGVKGDIDFALNEDSIGQIIKNLDITENLDSIKVIDSKTIEAYFKTDITATNIEARFYKNVGVSSVSINDVNKKEIDINLKNNLEQNSPYLLMVFSLKTIENGELAFPTGLYEFDTLEFNSNGIKKTEDTTSSNDPNSITNLASEAKEIPATGTETGILIFATFIMTSLVFLRRKFIK